MPPAPEVQLVWLSAALEALAAFLSSADAFRSLPDAPRTMRQDLSLGRLLLSLDALQTARPDLSAPDRSRWDDLSARWERGRVSHRAAIEAKASAELPRRFGSWRAYLQEMAETPSEAEDYAGEVRHRVVIERLIHVLGDRPPLLPALGRLDEVLHGWLEPAPFLWDDSLRRLYPQPRFWYLWGRPTRALILANPAKV